MGTWFSTDFLQTVYRNTITWIITSVPSIILILVIAVISIKLSNILLIRARFLVIKRMKNGKPIDSKEMEKRVDTLLGILASTTRIIIWSIIGMILLGRLGIDIGPLVAGAGIAGVAVGFGAQELIRDLIAGFFILAMASSL